MALVTEDGTGLANAESFISVADADLYFSLRGDAAWGLLAESAKEAALRKATDYMQGAFGQRWKGVRLTQAQALSWPRYSVVVDGYTLPSDEVPLAVRTSCAELALRASTSALQPDQGTQVKSETVGPIAVVYADGARQGDRYASVETTLAALLRGGGMTPVVRA